jgi:hypothetical protein
MAKKKAQHGGKRKGAGRPPVDPKEKSQVLAVSVPPPLVAALEKVAKRNGWNRSQAATEAIKRLVEAET